MSNLENYFNSSPHNEHLVMFKGIHLSNDVLETKKFEFITKYINDPRIIIRTKLFLSSVADFSDSGDSPDTVPVVFSPKILLSTYIITQYPKTILELDEDEDIFMLSMRILNDIGSFINNVCRDNYNKMLTTFREFYVLFDLWITKDRNRILHNLAKSYWDIDAAIIFKMNNEDSENPNRDLWIGCAKDEQETIIRRVMSLGGKEALEYFNSLVPIMISEDVADNITGIVHSAFWDNFKDELSKDPPNYLTIIPMLEDTVIMLKTCIPHRTDIQAEIDEHIDIALIQQMIEHNAIDNATIIDLVNYIVTKLIFFDSELMDTENNAWHEELMSSLMSGVPFKDFFPKFFKKLFEKLEKINEFCELIRKTFEDEVEDEVEDGVEDGDK